MFPSLTGADEFESLFDIGGEPLPFDAERYLAVESGSFDFRSSCFGGIGLGERCVMTICGCGRTTATLGFSGRVVRQPAGGRSAPFSVARWVEALKI